MSKAFDSTPPLVLEPEVEHYVTLDMRVRPSLPHMVPVSRGKKLNWMEGLQLLNWSYLNFKVRTKTTTRLFAIKVMPNVWSCAVLDKTTHGIGW